MYGYVLQKLQHDHGVMYHQLTRKIINPSNLPCQPTVFRFWGPTQWRGAGRLKRNRVALIFKCNTQIKIGSPKLGMMAKALLKHSITSSSLFLSWRAMPKLL